MKLEMVLNAVRLVGIRDVYVEVLSRRPAVYWDFQKMLFITVELLILACVGCLLF